jgi:hypothetical protein
MKGEIMSIQDLKIGAWKNPIVNEADRPNRAPADMKAVFDSNSNELRDALNNVIDAVTVAAETIKNDLPNTQYLRGDGTYGVPEVGEAGNGVPNGGSIGQILTKKSAEDFDSEWINAHSVADRTLYASEWVDKQYVLSLGITDDSIVEIIPALSMTEKQIEALQGANLMDGGQTSGSIIIVAFGDVPEIDIPIRVIVWRV